MQRLAEGWAQREGVDVETATPGEVTLPMDAQAALLRIAQGALANVAQHADATIVRIDLVQDGDDVRLTIADDGRGFDPASAEETASGTDSFGLRAMRERVEQLDGELTVVSAAGAGTVVAVTLRGAAP